MKNADFEKLAKVGKAFCLQGELIDYEELKQGNINNTYRVDYRNPNGTKKSYMVQSVNTQVFKKPVEVMENIDNVTTHIRTHYPNGHVLHFHHTKDRKTYVFDENGFWRVFNYVPSRTFDVCDDLDVVRSAGKAFGEFQAQLRDFNAAKLHETIPNFHHTTRRYKQLMEDTAADRANRVKDVQEELEWLTSVRHQACMLTEMYEENKLPLRVTHNDTKINNVLFERNSPEAIVVIDLDTVMPGLVGHDFGDAIRFAANKVEEDCPDASKAGINMDIFRAFTEGFLGQMAPYLTENELNTLGISCFDLTCELAVRFLDDYINGDTYFKTRRPGHNLDRARCQIALAKDMQRHKDEMEQIVRECSGRA